MSSASFSVGFRVRARFVTRLLAVCALAALTAGCFKPLYADLGDGKHGVRDKLLGVELPPLNLPNGSRGARLGVEIRNDLAFKLYGGATGSSPTHQLIMQLTSSRSSLILDPLTALPSTESYSLDVNYRLVELGTGKIALTGSTFSKVSYDIPGQLQRFARARAFRDAEDRACAEIAENLNTRLASFFYAGI